MKFIPPFLFLLVMLTNFCVAQNSESDLIQESYSIERLGYHQKVADNVSTIGLMSDVAHDEVLHMDKKAHLVTEEVRDDFYIAYYESDDTYIEIFGSYTLDKFFLIWEPKKS